MRSSAPLNFSYDMPAATQHSLDDYLPFLDLKLYRDAETGEIWMGFDWISQSLNPPLPFSLIPANDDYNEWGVQCTQMLDQAHLEDKKFLSAWIEPVMLHDKESGAAYAAYSLVYKLPTRIHGALNFLGLFTYYLNTIMGVYDQYYHRATIKSIHIDSYPTIETFLAGHHQIESIKDCVSNEDFNGRTIMQKLFKQLISLRYADRKDAYEFTFAAIEKVATEYNKSLFVKLLELLMFDKRCSILHQETLSLMLNPEITLTEKKTQYIQFARELVKNNQQDQLPFVLDAVFQSARKSLCEKAVGMQADDGGLYNEGYTELTFLTHVECEMTQTGELMMTNFSKNPSYQEHYAQGKRIHDIFEREMKHLMNVLDLQTKEGCDFHQQITFTKEASEKLALLGFLGNRHFIQEIKRAIYKENFFSLFSRSQVDQQTNDKTILSLPEDALNCIQEKMEMARIKPRSIV